MSVYPPIAEYGFLSDCEVNSLVAPDGSVEWLCLPRPDAPSVFGALLDRRAGFFRFGPANTYVPDQRRYLPGTLVLETTWHTPTGWLTVQDLLVVGRTDDARHAGYRRPPGDEAALGLLLRLATCSSGRVEVEMNCLPLFEYGTAEGEWSYDGDGYRLAAVRSGELSLELSSSMQLGFVGARSYGRTTLEEGSSAFVALSWGGHAPSSNGDAFDHLRNTEQYWRNWLSTAKFPDHRFRPYIERSALALKGLSYAPTGAIMAAATTSLPETVGGERNWDYRYTWIRDSAFMLRALHDLGFDWEAFEYFAFLLETVTSQCHAGVRPPDHVRHRRRTRSDGAHARPSLRLSRTRVRFASATAPSTSASTTCGGCCSTRWPPHVRRGGQIVPRRVGRRRRRSSTSRSRSRPNPTRASGRCAAIRSTSSRRR